MLIGNGGDSGHFLKINVNIPDHSNWHYYTMVYDGTVLRDISMVCISRLMTQSQG